MRRLTKILAVLVVLLPSLVDAQTLTNRERRHINMRLMNLINQYEMGAAAYDDNTRYQFLDLYKDNGVQIYSDLLDYEPAQKVSVEDYVNSLLTKQNLSIEMKDVERQEYTWKDDAWHTIVKFRKSLIYNDENNILFSSKEQYNTDYFISLDCVYDSETDRCYINSIEGSLPDSVELMPRKFTIINHNSEMDDKLIYDGEPIKYNSFNQAFIADKNLLKPWRQDVRIKADTLAKAQSYALVNVRYKRTPWRVKPRYAMTMGQAFEVSSPVNFKTLESSASEYGLDLGVAVSGRAVSFGLYAGAAMSTSNISFAAGDYRYSYATTDSKGVEYARVYEITSATESIKYSDLVVPAYLSFDIRLFKLMTLGFSAGAKLYLNGDVTVTPYHMSGRVYGSYSSEKVTSDASERFESFDQDYTKLLYPNSYTRNTTDLSVMGGVSLNINLFKEAIYLYGKYSYEMGLTDVHVSDENMLYGSSVYPMVYSARLNSNIATRSFMDCVSYKRNAMWLEFGLMFKL
ncbi:MAG: hypothetical protein IKY82_08290 [Alistipes sp.]|nr:hypothetical protein [Alistipes sp.]